MDTKRLADAISCNQAEELKFLIQQDPSIVNQKIALGRADCLLELAVYQNSYESVKCLLEHNARPDGVYDDEIHEPPLAQAIRNCHLDIISSLLEYGANVDLLWNTLIFKKAFEESRQDIIKRLFDKGFNPSVVASKSRTPLLALAIKTAKSDNSPLVKLLIDYGCGFHSITPEISISNEIHRGSSVLECLIYRGFDRLIRYLLRVVHSRDELLPKDRTMLQLLCIYGGRLKIETIELLLDGEMSDNPDNAMQYSAFFLAVMNGNCRMVEYLLDHGADINQVSHEGNNALITALEKGQKKIADILVKRGIDLNFVGASRMTALDMLSGNTLYIREQTILAKELEKAGAEHSDKKEQLLLTEIVEVGEVWAEQAIEALSNLGSQKLTAWNTLLKHCQTNKSSKPSARWMKQAVEMVDAIGRVEFREKLRDWLKVLGELRTKGIGEEKLQDGRFVCGGSEFYGISFNNTLILKSLIWLSLIDDSDREMITTLKEVVWAMFKKIPDVGIRNAKIGNAALYALSKSNCDAAISQIAMLRAKAKYPPAKKYIDKVYREIAEHGGISLSELDMMARESIKMTRMGEYEKAFGEYSAVIRLNNGTNSDLIWLGVDKEQKAIPAAVKNNKQFADDISEIKALKKDIDSLVSTVRFQLEHMYTRDASLSGAEWRKRYIDDYLVGTLGRRLIWHVEQEGISFETLYIDGDFIDTQNEPVTIKDNAAIRLWHPMMSSDETKVAVRDLIIKYGIVQPFKQAHREVYILSKYEESESSCERFKGHIIRQHQFHTLAEQRGWKQIRTGEWDGGDDACAWRLLPNCNLTVYLDAEPEENLGNNTPLYEYLVTGPVYFLDSDENEVAIGQLNKQLLSEVFRDIDMFISVASVGNVPDWEYREQVDYWKKFGLGELTEIGLVRKSVLQSILPSLKHADKYSIDGDYLVAQGDLHQYRIHIGSICVLMDSNDLCLSIDTVRISSFSGIPFDEDSGLTKILTLAQMLVNDKKIKDKDILAQIMPRS